MPTLELSRKQLAAMADHAVADLPRECCGVLVGRFERQRTIVEAVIAAPNVAAVPTSGYEIDPRALVDAHRLARLDGLELVGYYHSHPEGRSIPSRRDRAAAWPEATYLIVATAAGAVVESRAWRSDQAGGLEEQPIRFATPDRGAVELVEREITA